MLIQVAGIDPSLRNTGIVRMDLELGSLETAIREMRLFETEKQTGKTVRQNSDDLRRAQELYKGMCEMVQDCHLVFAEIPTGAQSARAALSFGIAIGLLSACPVPIIQVQPFETKLATVGTKTASKEEIIEWAGETYPAAAWLTKKRNGKQELVAKNEHLADAAAIVHAGLKTQEFQRLRSIWLGAK